jgi:hypothetical protein
MKKGMVRLMSAACAISLLLGFLLPTIVWSEEDWKSEFEEVCSKTDTSMTLSKEELKGLITRCENLEVRIGAEDESVRKVYLRRLKICSDFFAYMLESKEAESGELGKR